MKYTILLRDVFQRRVDAIVCEVPGLFDALAWCYRYIGSNPNNVWTCDIYEGDSFLLRLSRAACHGAIKHPKTPDLRATKKVTYNPQLSLSL